MIQKLLTIDLNVAPRAAARPIGKLGTALILSIAVTRVRQGKLVEGLVFVPTRFLFRFENVTAGM